MDELFPIAIILELVLIGIDGMFFYYFFNKIRNKDPESENPFHKPYTLFFLFIFIAEILYCSLIITTPVEYRFLFWNNPNIGIIFLFRLTMILRAFGYAAIVYTIEKNLFKEKKHFLTIIFLIVLTTGQILQIFASEEFSVLIALITLIGLGLTFFLPIGYIYIGFKSSGTVKKKCLLIGFSFVLLILINLAMTPIFLETWGVKEILDINIIFIIVVSMRICGIPLIFWGFKEYKL